jgi:uncharacterized protein
MTTEYQINNNENTSQFEYSEGDELARLEYRFFEDKIAMMHTVVPESLEGKGIASALAKEAFAYAKQGNKKVMVYCPFVAAYVKRHPEVREQLDQEFHKGKL